ncbi:MAG TPA: PEP-CTERM sorting domain-containing protein [Verrucomicrobiales bacterium]|nr:PEP-CTERM sorting domain-containing protein [Verrucomicrobiales bacterium]
MDKRRFLSLGLVLLGSMPITGRAAVMVEGTVIPLGGGAFSYSYAVTNTEAEALSIVSIFGPLGDALIQATLQAPLGFAAFYDDGFGIVDLFEDVSAFEPFTTTGDFTFHSMTGPGDEFATFEALTVEGNFISGDVVNRLIPEPSVTLLAFLGVCATLALRRRKVIPR